MRVLYLGWKTQTVALILCFRKHVHRQLWGPDAPVPTLPRTVGALPLWHCFHLGSCQPPGCRVRQWWPVLRQRSWELAACRGQGAPPARLPLSICDICETQMEILTGLPQILN